MEKYRHLTPEITGKVICNFKPPYYGEIPSIAWKKGRYIFILVSVVSAMLLLFLDLPIPPIFGELLLVVSLISFSLFIISFINWDAVSDAVVVYENGFLGKIGKGTVEPGIGQWIIDRRFVRYDEISRVCLLKLRKYSIPVIKIGPDEKYFFCTLPLEQMNEISGAIIDQAKRKGIDLKVV
jgi:hypothetical protein